MTRGFEPEYRDGVERVLSKGSEARNFREE